MAAEPRGQRINFLVSAKEKAEIQAAAKMHGRSVTGYFLTLHRLAMAMVAAQAGRRKAN